MSIGSTSAGVLNVAGSVGGIAQSVSNLAGLLGGAIPGTWKSALKVASYGGVKFGVESDVLISGRKGAIHSYPFRDTNWIEDLGQRARQFEVSCFLVEDDIVLRAGGVVAQRDALLKVCESPGAKSLVHPTLGTIEDVACLGIEISERLDMGRVFQIKLILIKSGKRLYPTEVTSTSDAVTAKAALTGVAALADFASTVATAVMAGASIVQQAISTAVGWYQFVIGVVNDVKSIINAVSTLAGNFGALFGGANTGFTDSNPKSPGSTTANSLLCQATANRAIVTANGLALQAACANPSDAASLGVAVQNLTASVAAAAINPADAVRLLGAMAAYRPAGTVAPGQIGTDMATMNAALSGLFRRYALSQLAIALTTYQPSSQNDANAVLSSSVAIFDAEITVAGDAGDDRTYQALRALRQSVIADVTARGADLSVIAGFAYKTPMPSLVLANRMYRSIDRETGLVQQIAPIHPAFCPTSFQALAN